MQKLFSNKVLIPFVVIGLLLMGIYIKHRRDSLLAEYDYATAIITDTRIGIKPVRIILEYTYIVKGVKYTSSDDFSELKIRRRSLLGHKIAIVHSTKYPEVTVALLTKETIERYRISLPDSLSWVRSYD